MKIVYGIDDLPPTAAELIMTIGAYDGVHLGHQAILRQVIQRRGAGLAVVLTFSPHPQKVVAPSSAPRLLQTSAQKREVLSSLGIDYLVEIPFTQALSELSPQTFVREVLSRRLPGQLHVGSNFRFGHNRSGDCETLRKEGDRLGFSVFAASQVSIRGIRISSSRIRQLISEGKVSTAGRLLGRPYQLVGTVVRGDGRGRGLGFPTANLDPRSELLPANGVYAARVSLGDRCYAAVANIGYRPTVDSLRPARPIVECHLFDFNGNLYGRDLGLDLIVRLRPEQRFADVQSLVRQIRSDAKRAGWLLARIWPSLSPPVTTASLAGLQAIGEPPSGERL